jgi:hypothetical protein
MHAQLMRRGVMCRTPTDSSFAQLPLQGACEAVDSSWSLYEGAELLNVVFNGCIFCTVQSTVRACTAGMLHQCMHDRGM